MTKTLITSAQLRALSPKCEADLIAPELDRACRARSINTDRRLRHFLAHIAHESLGFTRLVEDLTYRSAERIRAVWPRRFPTIASARPFVRNPRALAEKVYGGRLGNSAPGDGYRYRGGGFIMNTGKANFVEASAHSGRDLVAEPELLRSYPVAADAAAGFWFMNGLNRIVDADNDEVIVATFAEHLARNEADDLVDGTVRINGGRIGLEDRRVWLRRAGAIWSEL